jgi:hypothetical protein
MPAAPIVNPAAQQALAQFMQSGGQPLPTGSPVGPTAPSPLSWDSMRQMGAAGLQQGFEPWSHGGPTKGGAFALGIPQLQQLFGKKDTTTPQGGQIQGAPPLNWQGLLSQQ